MQTRSLKGVSTFSSRYRTDIGLTTVCTLQSVAVCRASFSTARNDLLLMDDSSLHYTLSYTVLLFHSTITNRSALKVSF